MPNRKQSGRCGCRKNSRKAYKVCLQIRKMIADAVRPTVRQAYRTMMAIDRAISHVAAELRRRELEEDE